eukprot:UN31218
MSEAMDKIEKFLQEAEIDYGRCDNKIFGYEYEQSRYVCFRLSFAMFEGSLILTCRRFASDSDACILRDFFNELKEKCGFVTDKKLDGMSETADFEDESDVELDWSDDSDDEMGSLGADFGTDFEYVNLSYDPLLTERWIENLESGTANEVLTTLLTMAHNSNRKENLV